ncbi:putative at hook domain-containing protein [Diaporthe ampelina]|uniref:Putative at hook domain-containing protein n=1 Tax=Diaporthe ampelina TaxID=1214573 RepID=A0A0G2FU34_9PEZI|nr:putative at hook domain-containing protein [Diaporthe ampelina]
MPSIATHPQAKFDPIPPDLDLHGLVDRAANFEWVQRIPASRIRKIEFEKLVWYQVIKQGKPLVIEGWNSKLPRSLFSSQWLEGNYDKKQENVRDINSQSNIPMTMGHYLRSMRQLTDQWTPNNFQDERRQRLYLKDIDCPPEWHDHLRKVMPPGLFYFNENVEDHGLRDDDLFMEEHTAAPAGDLMSSLPPEMRAQNLMCYIGHEGTYTPAHREMCGSLGQNIMVEASSNENGEKEGSSIWFMTETKDRQIVREYFLSMLGHDVEIEKHFAQINAWKKATFPVYVVEQRPGDFILIPPLAPHQVWNRGTRTMKVAWNRTTVDTLDYALHEALPRARLVCRDEQYKNKAIIYYTLQKYYQQLQDAAESQMSLLLGDEVGRDSARLTQLKKDFKRLLQLFTEILVDEMFASKEKNVEMIPFDSCVICSYCRSNIFNKFLTCKNCVRDLIDGDQDTYDVCMECYAMGRSCLCVSGLSWCEQWDWSELVDNYEAWRSMVIFNDGYVDMNLSPPPLEVARMKIGRKALAQNLK